MAARSASLKWLSDEYRELNGLGIDILDYPPSALEFSRLLRISRPVIIKGLHLKASECWTDDYLAKKMGHRKVSIAITPNGRADAVARGPGNRLYFVEPVVEQMPMADFLSRLSTGEVTTEKTSSETKEVCYLQSQNGNLFPVEYFQDANVDSELKSLRTDVPSEIPWCSQALDRTPDAVNVWIGDRNSVTSIHSDPYENIYAVVRGAKHFTLLPPTDAWCLKERLYPHATYKRPFPNSPLAITPSGLADIRWSSITDPDHNNSLPSTTIQPLQITLRPGEVLYIPVGWWHHVRQSEGITIAVNWWYDAELRGMTWVLLNFLRGAITPANSNDEENGEAEN